jgi:hypothetical protein
VPGFCDDGDEPLCFIYQPLTKVFWNEVLLRMNSQTAKFVVLGMKHSLDRLKNFASFPPHV